MVKKTVYSAIICSVILIGGCAAKDQTWMNGGTAISTSGEELERTNPDKVKVYSDNELPSQYTVIGHVSADNYSIIAMQRSKESVTQELKNQAASIGGTGVINVSTGPKRTTGDVILN